MHEIVDVRAFYIRAPSGRLFHKGAQLAVNDRGYIVDPDNGTVYPADDRTVLIRVETRSGLVGWGETYGITAGRVIGELVDDVIAPLLAGRSPLDVRVIWQMLYNLMRVRGYVSGFYQDALAAVDIALWDLCGKIHNQPLYNVLGGAFRTDIPCYITNIPGTTVEERLASVAEYHAQGYRAFKVHAAANFDYVSLIHRIRATYGQAVSIMLDLHWVHTSAEALAILKRLEGADIAFVEAPVRYEDIDGLARVAAQSPVPVAGGEEWRTLYDAQARLKLGALSIVQPEMGRTGITQFLNIAALAAAYHARVIPHATIGFGVFMAASLHASAATPDLPMHEYQNLAFGKHLALFETDMQCGPAGYRLPTGPGLGITPSADLLALAV